MLNLYSFQKQPHILWAVWSVKAKMTPAESVFSLHRHAMPCHRWRCLLWLSSTESKSPRGTKLEAYPLCMGEQGRKHPASAMEGESKLDTDGSTQLQGNHTDTYKEIALKYRRISCSWLFPISICSTWWNYNFHYLIDPIISRRGRYRRISFPMTLRLCRG